MEIRTKDPKGSVDRIYGTIAKAASKNKFLDLRNSLTLAYLEDYANIQGIGGSKHAPVSGIKLLIQDNTSGSQKAEAIIPCFLVDKMLQVCRSNAVEMYADGSAMSFQLDRTAVATRLLLKNMASACGHMVKQKYHPAGPFAEFGSAAKGAESAFTDFEKYPVVASGKPYAEFSYRQERVNTYYKSNDGFVKVSVLSIQRKQFNSKNEVMKSPWIVSISNFEAFPNQQKNGTTSYQSSSKRNEINLFIQVSDDDMWRCLYAVSHFISVWEMAYGIPLVQSGIAAYEQQQISFHQNQQGSDNGQNETQPGYQQTSKDNSYYSSGGNYR